MNIPFELIKKGVSVVLKKDFGVGEEIKVIVQDVAEHKGRNVIDYIHDGHGHWAYFHQIIEVLL